MFRKRVALGFVILLVVLPSAAQKIPPAVDRSYQFILQIYLVKPRTGMAQKFEEALKQHMAWLRQQHETWSWTTWQMLSGEHFGEYAISSFNHRWKDFDAHAEFSEAERTHWEATVAPYTEKITCMFYKERPELSYDKPQNPPPMYQGLKFVHVKLPDTTEFTRAVKKMQEALEKTNVVGESLWYQMIRGAEHPLYLWLIPMKSLDELEPPPGKSVPELVLQYYGEKEGMPILEAMEKTVQVYNSEISRARPQLSYTPTGH